MANEQTILDDPSASTWLKSQINKSKERDPVDALNDAEVLVEVLAARLKKLQSDLSLG